MCFILQYTTHQSQVTRSWLRLMTQQVMFVQVLAADATAHQLRVEPDRKRPVEKDPLSSRPIIDLHRSEKDGFIRPELLDPLTPSSYLFSRVFLLPNLKLTIKILFPKMDTVLREIIFLRSTGVDLMYKKCRCLRSHIKLEKQSAGFFPSQRKKNLKTSRVL